MVYCIKCLCFRVGGLLEIKERVMLINSILNEY